MARQQHSFLIQAEIVTIGDTYEETRAAAMEAADAMYEWGPFDMAHILVTETGRQLLDGPSGVFCEGCDGHPISGVRWPTMKNSDDSHEWVERCDTCSRYDDDEAALECVKEFYEGTGAIKSFGFIDGMGYHIEVG